MTNVEERQILLWHHRLRHPPFGYMKFFLLDLFFHLQDSKFKCNGCILTKSHYVSYPIGLNKSEISLALIHSNV